MYQLPYDEEEFEPRVIPKPITKNDCITGPTVPEVSLIFETRLTRNTNNGNEIYSSAEKSWSGRSGGQRLFYDQCRSSPTSNRPSSYSEWSHENDYRGINTSRSKTCFLQSGSVCNDEQSLYKNSQHYLRSTSIPNEPSQKKFNGNERLQNITKNDKTHEKTVKFKCSNTEDSYDLEKTHLASEKRYLPSDSVQKAMLSIIDHTMENPSVTTDTSKKSDNCQIPHSGHQQLHVPSYSNCNMDNNETVKTLLQLVNSQNEQIKSLQLQVDRLIRLQEENLKNKPMCLCSQPLANQMFRYPLNCYDSGIASSLVQSQNRSVKKNAASQNMSVAEKQNLENINENNKFETGSEQQPKKAFVEQKVSIGVMTSFEFTVQNNPFLVDSEICEKNETYKEDNNMINAHNTTELVNRYKNTYVTRKPGPAQLENIVEDTESYLSSSQQQSSNFNASSSVKESSKMHQYPPADLNREETRKDINTKKDDKMDNGENIAKKTLNTPFNVNCSSIGSANYNEVLAKQTNDCIAMKGKRNYKTNTDEHSFRHVDLPMTDYYCNHKNKEYSSNVKPIKDVDDSIILSGGDLKVLERPPPTPEPSIHVDMYEYTSDDESDKLGHTPNVGRTFYKNVLERVNEILKNSGVMNDEDINHPKKITRNVEENDVETKTALNAVKEVNLEQLRKFEINLTENNENKESNANKTSDFDSSFYPRLAHQANVTHATSAANETNISMHMKALALKYLSDEQLADIASHEQESSSLLMLSNMQGTNMSLATMHYLEKCKLLRKNNVQAENAEQMYDKILSNHAFKPAAVNNNPALHPAPYRYPLVQSGVTCPSKILDISTLKKQRKL
ncbi:hypothetical protein PUN28_014065 [Cardiocondyla obscurior]